MPKKLKVIDSDDGVDPDSDKKKKVKKKTKAKKKTTKKCIYHVWRTNGNQRLVLR